MIQYIHGAIHNIYIYILWEREHAKANEGGI